MINSPLALRPLKLKYGNHSSCVLATRDCFTKCRAALGGQLESIARQRMALHLAFGEFGEKDWYRCGSSLAPVQGHLEHLVHAEPALETGAVQFEHPGHA